MSVVPPGVLPGGTGGRVEDGCKGTRRFGSHTREDVLICRHREGRGGVAGPRKALWPGDQLEGRPVLATRLDCVADRQRAVLAAVSARFSMTVDNEDHERGDNDGEEDDGEAGRSLRVAMRPSRCCLGPARADDSGWLGQAETDT